MTRDAIRTSLIATALIASSLTGASAQAPAPHPYVGMWVTADGHVRHELLPNAL